MMALHWTALYYTINRTKTESTHYNAVHYISLNYDLNDFCIIWTTYLNVTKTHRKIVLNCVISRVYLITWPLRVYFLWKCTFEWWMHIDFHAVVLLFNIQREIGCYLFCQLIQHWIAIHKQHKPLHEFPFTLHPSSAVKCKLFILYCNTCNYSQKKLPGRTDECYL